MQGIEIVEDEEISLEEQEERLRIAAELLAKQAEKEEREMEEREREAERKKQVHKNLQSTLLLSKISSNKFLFRHLLCLL